MRERLAHANGHLEMESSPRGGVLWLHSCPRVSERFAGGFSNDERRSVMTIPKDAITVVLAEDQGICEALSL